MIRRTLSEGMNGIGKAHLCCMFETDVLTEGHNSTLLNSLRSRDFTTF